jgi:large subunit ribosomal protein L21
MNSKTEETNKYAIIKTGGKQYRVSENDVIDVELLNDAKLGSEVSFEVLFVNDGQATNVGTPSVPGFVVTGELLGFSTGPKITSMKYKASHHQYRKFGHRQHYSRVKITGIGKDNGGKHGS